MWVIRRLMHREMKSQQRNLARFLKMKSSLKEHEIKMRQWAILRVVRVPKASLPMGNLKDLVLGLALILPTLQLCMQKQLIQFCKVLKKTRSREHPACMGQTATGKINLQVAYNSIISMACSYVVICYHVLKA